MRPTRTGEAPAGSYVFPSTQVRQGEDGTNGTTQEDDMVEMELEMLRARGRRLATPPPNTFQPILSMQSHNNVPGPQGGQANFAGQPYLNVTHLLRPVHSPVPNIPPGSRLPPMSSTPPPNLMAMKQQEQSSPSSSSSALAFSFPTTRTMLGNPYTSPVQTQTSFPLLGGGEMPGYSSPIPATNMAAVSQPLPATASNLTLSAGPSSSDLMKQQQQQQQQQQDPFGNLVNDNPNMTAYPPREMMHHQPAMHSPAVDGYATHPDSHVDFPPLLHGSHPGRDSAEPCDDPSASTLLPLPTEDHAPHNEGTLAMLAAARSSFASHDDSEDEHMPVCLPHLCYFFFSATEL